MNSILRQGLSKSIRLPNKSQIQSFTGKKGASITTLLKNNNDNNNNSFLKSSLMNLRSFSSLPYHLVVGMPALSPTMEAGTISSWKVAEGESFAAGDSLAEIETDKATIDFEAQDDGVIAKILVEAGSGEINVGVPILVTVEDEADVAAFKDFVAPVTEKKAEEPATATPEPTPIVETKVETTEPVVTKAAEPKPEPSITSIPEAAPVEIVESQAQGTNVAMVSPGWGNFAKVKSPLAQTLSSSQKKYIELYGSTGQLPL